MKKQNLDKSNNVHMILTQILCLWLKKFLSMMRMQKITLVFMRSRQFTLIMETVPIYDLDPDITSLIEKIPQYDAYAKITFVLWSRQFTFIMETVPIMQWTLIQEARMCYVNNCQTRKVKCYIIATSHHQWRNYVTIQRFSYKWS